MDEIERNETISTVLQRVGLACSVHQALEWASNARYVIQTAARRLEVAHFYDEPEAVEATHQTICQLAQWQHQKFGLGGPARSLELALGVVEEGGEFTTAIVNMNAPEMEDAQGDIAIYLAQLLFHEGLSLAPLFLPVASQPALVIPRTGTGYVYQQSRALGILAHIVLKHQQRTRGLQHREVYLACLCAAAHAVLQTHHIQAKHLTATAAHILTRDRSADIGGDSVLPPGPTPGMVQAITAAAQEVVSAYLAADTTFPKFELALENLVALFLEDHESAGNLHVVFPLAEAPPTEVPAEPPRTSAPITPVSGWYTCLACHGTKYHASASPEERCTYCDGNVVVELPS